MKTLSIIIVNWNAGSMLEQCVRSIAESSVDGFVLSSVVIVDNDSSDNSIDLVRKYSDDLPLLIQLNKKNVGFGAACNQGVALSNSDYILFLNPDMLLKATTLSSSVAKLDSLLDQNVAVLGIQLNTMDGLPQLTSCRKPGVSDFFCSALGLDKLFPGLFSGYVLDENAHKTSQCIFHVIGAYYLMVREVFDQLDGFDPDYFVYYEDIDLSARVNQLGYDVYYDASIVAGHVGGGTSSRIKAKRLFYSLSAKFIYAIKHFSFFGVFGAFIAIYFIEPIVRLLNSLFHGRLAIMSTMRGILMLWGGMRAPFRVLIKSVWRKK